MYLDGKSKYYLGDEKDLMTVARKSREKYMFCCGECLHRFEISPYDIFLGKWCQYCANKKICLKDKCCVYCIEKSFSKNLLSRLWSKNNDRPPEEVLITSSKKYLLTCEKCFYEYTITPSKIETHKTCRKCKYLNLVMDSDITFLNKKYYNDETFVRQCLPYQPKIFKHVSELLQNNKSIALLAISYYAINFKYASLELKHDVDIIVQTLKKDPNMISYVEEKYVTKDIIQHAFSLASFSKIDAKIFLRKISGNWKKDFDFANTILKKKDDFFPHLPFKLRDNKNFCMSVLEKDGKYYSSLSQALKKDEQIIETALLSNANVIDLLKNIERKHIDIALQARILHNNIVLWLKLIPENILKEKKVIHIIAEKYGKRVCEIFENKYIKKYLNDRFDAFFILSYNYATIKFLPKKHKKDKSLYLKSFYVYQTFHKVDENLTQIISSIKFFKLKKNDVIQELLEMKDEEERQKYLQEKKLWNINFTFF